MAIGLVLHTIYLLNRSKQADLPPLLSSTHDWLLVLAWLGISVTLFLSLVDKELSLGLFLLPPLLAMVGAANFVSDIPSGLVAPNGLVLPRTVAYNWTMLHASLLVFGIGVVIVGFALSMMYLVQHRRLKKHKQGAGSGVALPSLEKLARLNWWAVMTSIPLLTLGMVTGVGLGWYSKKTETPFDFGDPVVIVNGILWILLAVFFCWLRLTRRPAEKQVAWLTIWAFGFLLVTLIGLQVLTGGHAASQQSRLAPEANEVSARKSRARMGKRPIIARNAQFGWTTDSVETCGCNTLTLAGHR
jgi:ABC-type transport system involved in cytochrome c biogenesis permease subunit